MMMKRSHQCLVTCRNIAIISLFLMQLPCQSKESVAFEDLSQMRRNAEEVRPR